MHTPVVFSLSFDLLAGSAAPGAAGLKPGGTAASSAAAPIHIFHRLGQAARNLATGQLR